MGEEIKRGPSFTRVLSAAWFDAKLLYVSVDAHIILAIIMSSFIDVSTKACSNCRKLAKFKSRPGRLVRASVYPAVVTPSQQTVRATLTLTHIHSV